MPAPHDLDPLAMTDDERRAKRRFEAFFAFETMPDLLTHHQSARPEHS